MQLVGDNVAMYDSMKDKQIGVPEVIEKWGVPPEKMIDLQALTGDSVDNVPGIPGIGPKTAAQLLEQFGDLDTLLERAGEIKQNKRRENIIASRDLVLVSHYVLSRTQVAARVRRVEGTLVELDAPVTMEAGSDYGLGYRVYEDAEDSTGAAQVAAVACVEGTTRLLRLLSVTDVPEVGAAVLLYALGHLFFSLIVPGPGGRLPRPRSAEALKGGRRAVAVAIARQLTLDLALLLREEHDQHQHDARQKQRSRQDAGSNNTRPPLRVRVFRSRGSRRELGGSSAPLVVLEAKLLVSKQFGFFLDLHAVFRVVTHRLAFPSQLNPYEGPVGALQGRAKQEMGGVGLSLYSPYAHLHGHCTPSIARLAATNAAPGPVTLVGHGVLLPVPPARRQTKSKPPDNFSSLTTLVD